MAMQYDPTLDMLVERPVAGGIAQAVPAGPIPARPAAAGINYSELRKKKAVADALRGKVGQGYAAQDPTYTVKGNNTVPDFVAVNYGGILQNAMSPLMEGWKEDKAAAAEAESQAARSAALEQMLGAGDKLSMRDAIMAKENLGVDLSGMVKDPGAERAKAMAMIAQNPAMAAGYLADGTIDQATVDAINTARKDMSAEEWEQKQKELRFEAGLKPAPAGKQRDPMKDLQALYVTQLGQGNSEGAQKTLEQIQALTVAGAAPKAGAAAGAGGRGKAADPAQEAASLRDMAGQLQTLLDDPNSDKDLFSTSQSILIPAAMNVAGSDAGQGSLLTQVAGKVAQGQESPAAAIVRRLGTEASFAKVKDLYPASNSDIALARSLQAQAGQSREAMQRYVTHMGLMADRAASALAAKEAGAPVAGAQEGATPEITTQADFDALPSGAMFMEGGRMYRKP